ncbi:MAG: CFI-box-CTERM domain-containing protein [Gammaproteobacteria bacterium]
MTLLWLGLATLPAGAVDINVPGDQPTIQDAIDAAVECDDVVVAIGTYSENLQLRTGVDVRGVETARTFLVAADNALPLISATNVDTVQLSNFTLIDSGAGVVLLASDAIVLANNVFDSLTGIGISVGLTSEAFIENNVFWDNGTAITRLSANATITNNVFAENTVTINSPVDIGSDENVSYNCFYQNDDLPGGSLGSNFRTGNPLLVDPAARDFHLREDSPCINTGLGMDIIDMTVADIGAYGGQAADATPFLLPQPTASNTSTTAPDVFSIRLDWDANLAYLVTNTVMPGSYNVWYQQNAAGPPYAGTDAGNGTEPAPIPVGNVTTFTLTDLQPAADTPGVPVLTSASPENRAVRLSWQAASGATGYRVYYGETVVTENTLDVGDTTTYTVTGLSNDTAYLFAVSALTQPVYHLSVTALDSTTNQNQSDFAPDVAIAVGNPAESALSNQLSATPEVVVPYPNLPDEGCFIATAAFGADWVAEVQILRDFRDRYLLSNAPGRSFVAWYYRYGPTAAHYLNEHAQFKPLVRAALWPLVVFAAFLLGAGTLSKGVVLLLSVKLIAAVCRSPQHQATAGAGRLL